MRSAPAETSKRTAAAVGAVSHKVQRGAPLRIRCVDRAGRAQHFGRRCPELLNHVVSLRRGAHVAGTAACRRCAAARAATTLPYRPCRTTTTTLPCCPTATHCPCRHTLPPTHCSCPRRCVAARAATTLPCRPTATHCPRRNALPPTGTSTASLPLKPLQHPPPTCPSSLSTSASTAAPPSPPAATHAAPSPARR